ncbi:hypothetical protein J9B83_00095 [Marinomonas sp. A79]|uniref:Uncharacterized protein n=1 Tax=Marinomonas vulgaris TaxID=2823372 RepID=A0ABS5H6H6_9GAMM|nr:hypothetical protein [Marinomonas vulgaris]MBR7887323.1 hypothetical protein [Marinomonas vulgaris]
MNENDSCIVNLERTILKNGPEFLSHKLVIKGDLAYLKPTISAMSFCMIYIVVGVFLFGLAVSLLRMPDRYDLAVFLGGFGIAIGTFGIALIQPFLRRSRFDKTTNCFDNHKDHNVTLEHIVSLQINNKVIQSKHGLSYGCFELNLLTQHGRRINILNHGDEQQLLHDAELLGIFLDVEVKDYRREIIL